MSYRKKWKIAVLVGLLAAVLVFGHWQGRKELQNSPRIYNNYLTPQFLPETKVTPEEEKIPTAKTLPNFPFQSQAPLANWDQLHDEACEEASIILVDAYLNNISALGPEDMEKEILSMVDWEMKNWGGHHDLTLAQTLEMAESFYKLGGKIIPDANIDSIKREIAAGHPVIVPTAGRLLGNPNFRSPGPVYHMVVAIGYDENNIIVQDVGTRNGNHYVYNQKIFYNAWHDWTGNPDEITEGGKSLLVLYKKE